jgi:polysaccharide pyruvyl transferase WcaK-like protein
MAEQIVTGEQVLGASEGPRDVAETQRGQIPVCLLGASFDTGNLGVSALAESSILAIRKRWPEARVVLLASSREEGWHRLRLPDGAVDLQKVPVRFCKNVLLPCHYGVLFCYALLVRLLPFERVKRYLAGRNATLRLLLDTSLFVDVTGGDSFSDIYGMRRFTMAFLVRMLPLMLKKDLVLFPQTYGPFKRAVTRSMARFVLRRAKRVYSRDQAGLDVVKGLLGRSTSQQTPEFAPDVAFLLEPREPRVLDVDGLDAVDDETSTLVGLNVSGLIYYGGYSGGNEFKLKVEYKDLLDALVERLLQQEDVRLLLVPHVIPAGGYRGNTENDLAACLDVHRRLSQRYPGRLFVARGDYDQGEVKYVIGMCDFFIGTRMHSCIAALSQCIPAVGVAYSKKFKGVFATVDAEALVADMRSSDVDEILRIIGEAFASRRSMAARLRETVPEVKQRVSNLLEGLDL